MTNCTGMWLLLCGFIIFASFARAEQHDDCDVGIADSYKIYDVSYDQNRGKSITDETARFRCEGEFDGEFGCMPVKYIEFNWICKLRGYPRQRCFRLPIQMCMTDGQKERAREDPCFAAGFPLEIDQELSRHECIEYRLDRLEKKIDKLYEDVEKWWY
jgi:hypothetical protein